MLHFLLLLAILVPEQVRIYGTVRAVDSGQPIPHASVEIMVLSRRTVTDENGRYQLRVPQGRIEIRATALGYAPLSRQIYTDTAGERRLDFALSTQPIQLHPLTARSTPRQEGGAAERGLHEREVAPALVGMSGREIVDVPPLAEADVLRSLQSLPGVLPLNDLSARLHVQGGAADQNLYLWDGARIFAPYHMFGMFGSINPEAVGRVDFFRGYIPARFGGVLSSVVDVAPPAATAEPFQLKAGVGMLGARVSARGSAVGRRAQWLVAGRYSHTAAVADLFLDSDFPYAFFDVHGRGSFKLTKRDEVTVSGFTSADRFRLFFSGFPGSLSSSWRNSTMATSWQGERGGTALAARLWGSSYTGSMGSGAGGAAPLLGNRVSVGGASFQVSRPGTLLGYRLGLEVEGGHLDLEGSEDRGGFVVGRSRGRYFLLALYGAVEARFGALRLVPGLRVGREISAGRMLIEPRVSARMELTDDISVTAGAARAQQFLSTLQDDRYVLPGAPFWIVQPETAPASISDGLFLGVDGWRGTRWSGHVSGYVRRLSNVIRWRPSGVRTLDQVAFDDGFAQGASVRIRRHEGGITGWAGYTIGRARFEESGSGRRYAPAWDRTHSVDAAIFLHPSQYVTVSGRVVYGSGQPFWPRVGDVDSFRFSPLNGGIVLGEAYPVWGESQLRMADYYRLDGAVRGRFSFSSFDLELYASFLNLQLRPNPLFYKLTAEFEDDGRSRAELQPEHVAPFFPSIGFNLWF